MLGLQCTFHPFIGFPSYKAISHLSLSERVERMRDPEFKTRILAEKMERLAGDGTPVPPIADKLLAAIDHVAAKIFLLGERPDYEQSFETSALMMAKARGVAPLDMIYDLLLEDEGRALLYFPVYNYTEMSFDNVYTMMKHPLSIMGLSDGGAHVGTICDSSFPTYLLSYWTRDRARGNKIELNEAVRRLTSDVADYCGLTDRGRIREGLKANINVIDMTRLCLHPPEMVQDLPAGGQRLLQPAEGYSAVIVSGEIVLRQDQLTGYYPGRLVRMGQQGH